MSRKEKNSHFITVNKFKKLTNQSELTDKDALEMIRSIESLARIMHRVIRTN